MASTMIPSAKVISRNMEKGMSLKQQSGPSRRLFSTSVGVPWDDVWQLYNNNVVDMRDGMREDDSTVQNKINLWLVVLLTWEVREGWLPRPGSWRMSNKESWLAWRAVPVHSDYYFYIHRHPPLVEAKREEESRRQSAIVEIREQKSC